MFNISVTFGYSFVLGQKSVYQEGLCYFSHAAAGKFEYSDLHNSLKKHW